MKTPILYLRPLLSIALAFAFITASWVIPADAQKNKRKPVVISFGQPNIWSLEQAHYLLGRMHAQNLDLKARDLVQNDLDPNAVNGTRIAILKTLLEVNAQFDQGIGFQNQQLIKNERFNQDRRLELTTKRDTHRDASLQLSRDISKLQFERAQMVNAKASEDDLALKDAEIEQKKSDQAAIDKEVAFENDELKTLGAEPSGTPQAPTPSGSPFDKTKLPTSILDDVVKDDIKKLLDAAHDPRLDASTVLDNHIQMQYEIIAKQLTLLRDEVGPGERLVFLELPQSIYTTPGAGDEKMAQSWWHINGYTKTEPLVQHLLELYEIEAKWQRILSVPAFLKIAISTDLPMAPCLKKKAADDKVSKATQDEMNEPTFKTFTRMLQEFQRDHDTARRKALGTLFREGDTTFAMIEQHGARDTADLIEAIRNRISIKTETAGTDENKQTKTIIDANNSRVANQDVVSSQAQLRDQGEKLRIKSLKDDLLKILSDSQPDLCNPTYDYNSGVEYVRLDDELGNVINTTRRDIERRTARTVDIIPRQSSLNVNDIQETVKATGILAAFKFLFGFAGQINYQRQKEQYEQFLHQELYASGFGKGNRDFGWTFGALPGTNRVAPGVRTTYAAVVVPDDAESLVLSARGCYFPRKSNQPLDYNDGSDSDWGNGKLSQHNCGDEQRYIVAVPGGGDANNFWVTRVDYQQVKKEGQPAVVSIRGNNFSSQMGVLVDGVALRQSVGLAQPLLNGSSATDCNNFKIACGSIERVDTQQIVVSFVRQGTGMPVITLMAPGKSVDLNTLDVVINPDPNDPTTLIKRKLSELTDPYAIFPPPVEPTQKDELAITDLKVFRNPTDPLRAFAVVTGSKFTPATQVFMNGNELQMGPDQPQPPKKVGKKLIEQPPKQLKEFKEWESEKLYRLEFMLPPDNVVTVTVTDGHLVQSKTVDKPGPPGKPD